jgi:hypothetical protein
MGFSRDGATPYIAYLTKRLCEQIALDTHVLREQIALDKLALREFHNEIIQKLEKEKEKEKDKEKDKDKEKEHRYNLEGKKIISSNSILDEIVDKNLFDDINLFISSLYDNLKVVACWYNFIDNVRNKIDINEELYEDKYNDVISDLISHLTFVYNDELLDLNNISNTLNLYWVFYETKMNTRRENREKHLQEKEKVRLTKELAAQKQERELQLEKERLDKLAEERRRERNAEKRTEELEKQEAIKKKEQELQLEKERLAKLEKEKQLKRDAEEKMEEAAKKEAEFKLQQFKSEQDKNKQHEKALDHQREQDNLDRRRQQSQIPETTSLLYNISDKIDKIETNVIDAIHIASPLQVRRSTSPAPSTSRCRSTSPLPATKCRTASPSRTAPSIPTQNKTPYFIIDEERQEEEKIQEKIQEEIKRNLNMKTRTSIRRSRFGSLQQVIIYEDKNTEEYFINHYANNGQNRCHDKEPYIENYDSRLEQRKKEITADAENKKQEKQEKSPTNLSIQDSILKKSALEERLADSAADAEKKKQKDDYTIYMDAHYCYFSSSSATSTSRARADPNSALYIENYEERVEQRKKEIALEKQEKQEKDKACEIDRNIDMDARHNIVSISTTDPNSSLYIENYKERVEQRKKEIALEKEKRDKTSGNWKF